MHRVHRGQVLIQGQHPVLHLQHGGDEAGLPVVQVQHVGHKVDLGQRLQHGAAEVSEALTLVAAQAVDVAAAKVVLVIDEVVGDPIQFQPLDAHVLTPPAQIHVEEQHVLQLGAPLVRDGAVQRGDYPGVHALAVQLLGQRPHHVSQAACLGEGYAFGSHQQYFQHSHYLLARDGITGSYFCRSRWGTAVDRSASRLGW